MFNLSSAYLSTPTLTHLPVCSSTYQLYLSACPPTCLPITSYLPADRPALRPPTLPGIV